MSTERESEPRSFGQSAVAFISQPWNAMADLAEAVDDLICSFDYSYADAAMDTLAMLFFFWLLLALFIAWLVKYLYKRYKTGKAKAAPEEQQPAAAKKIETDESKRSKTDDNLPTGLETQKNAKVSTAAAAGPKGAFAAPARGGVPMRQGHVPATPPAMRKRMSRMSPGPDVQRKVPGSRPVSPPLCAGPDNVASRWSSSLIAWLYSDLVVVNDLLQLWILSMNEFSKKSVEEHGVGVELVRVLAESPAPKISNVFCECDSKEDVTITCDCEATPALQLKAFRQKGEKVEAMHYRVNINRFRARLNILCITEKLTGELHCDGWPDVKIQLAPVGPLRNNPDEKQLQEVISEIVASALRNTNVQFSLAHYPTCPRMKRISETPSRMLPLHYDSMLNQNPIFSSTPHPHGCDEPLLTGDKRLLVKVVSAQQLGQATPAGCHNPYCVVEMDEPPQRNQTSIKKDTDSPFWDEHFLFDLSPNTAEILFEIFDKGNAGSNPVFLGLGIVGVEELLISPSQRQLISLQSRPLQDDPVSGTLTLEFLFIEGADIPLTEGRPFKLKETLRTISPTTGQTTTTTRTVFKQHDGAMNGTSHLTESALRELDRSPSTQASKSTLIIHSVQRTPKQTKVERNSSGEFIEVEKAAVEKIIGKIENIQEEKDTNEEVPIEQTPLSTENRENNHNEPHINGTKNLDVTDKSSTEKKDGDIHSAPETNGEPPERIPRQKKRRDFFGTIKRRLNRSRTRARSVDMPDSGSEDNNLRSVSADRNMLNENNLSVPSPNKTGYSSGLSSANSPAQSGDESRASRRSSISEMSAVSGASTRTYLHEASTLVLETLDNGVRKHFLVPLAIAQRSRWRRKGTKLHIFNDHTFVAKHLSGGIVCQVCNKNIARRIGKQGYECRDCLLKCHKHCHVRVGNTCPSSTIHTIELSLSEYSFGNTRQYITSPFTDKNIRML